jgi:hypothetical protein
VKGLCYIVRTFVTGSGILKTRIVDMRLETFHGLLHLLNFMAMLLL